MTNRLPIWMFGIFSVKKIPCRNGRYGSSKTAYGFVRGYERDYGKFYRDVEVERLAAGGVKRTTGQHPGELSYSLTTWMSMTLHLFSILPMM